MRLAPLLCAGCVPGVAVRQVTTTHVVEQVAMVPGPSEPLAVAAPLARGQALALGGASYAAVRSSGDALGQQVAPLLGVGRVAAGVSDGGLEVAASGGLGPTSLRGPEPGSEAFTGAVGRGDLGLRGWFPLRSTDVGWAWSADVGVVASLYRRTDRWTVEERVRGAGTTTTEDVLVAPDAVKLHPDLRLGTLLRVPVPSWPAHATAGLQLQTWPVYWGAASRTETCVSYLGGAEECSVSGDVPSAAAALAAVLTPSLGAAWRTDDLTVHVQVYAHVGSEATGRVPAGVAVLLERRSLTR